MSDQDEFDTRLAAHFEQEHRHLPDDAFIADTLRKIRAGRQRREFMRVGWRVAALGAAVVASPWLIAGAERLNSALESSLDWASGRPGSWALGGLAVLLVLAVHVRIRSRR